MAHCVLEATTNAKKKLREAGRFDFGLGRMRFRDGLRDEGAADSCAAAFEALGVGFVEDDANGRKNRNVEHRVELGGELVGFVEDEGHTAVTEIDDGCVALTSVGEDRVCFRAGERYAFPFAMLRSLRG
jgi:hypothetical protein